MPIYEFECGKCGEHFEDLVRSDKEEVHCPRCSGRRVRRLFSAFAIHGAGSDSGSAGSSCSSCSAKSCSNCG